jgi:hypothetical protein
MGCPYASVRVGAGPDVALAHGGGGLRGSEEMSWRLGMHAAGRGVPCKACQ